MEKFDLYIYTDGSYDMKKNIGGYALVVINGQNEEVFREYQKATDSTSNRMEYTALIRALEYLQEYPTPGTVLIQSDSQLLVNTYNQWMESWAQKGWVRSAGEIKNLDLVQKLFELKPKFPRVKVQWIKAHNGHEWNELVDQLTRKAYQS
jgi:ribonuclease HI